MTALDALARRAASIGPAAAIVTFVAMALLFAFEQPPFVAPDETAHVGYAHEIAGFRLPEITEFPVVPDSAVQWQAERESARDDRYRGVWVANHPPLHYVATAPLIWLSDALDRADGGLMFMRLANIAFAATGVGFTYLLARDLSGGVRRLGVVAAALAALVPQAQVLFAQAMNDGLGFAAATAVVWAGVRCLSAGTGSYRRGDLLVLGAAAAACAGARSSTLAVAVVVVAWVSVASFVSAGGSLRARLGTAGLAVGYGLLPAVVLFGWHYLRNQGLYGDIAGSEFLLDRFGREPRGSLFEVLTRGNMWIDLYHMLMSPSPLRFVRAPLVNLVLVLTAAGLLVVAVSGRVARQVVTRPALALCLTSVAVVVLTVAQHVSGGGSRYARYLLPALGVAAALIAIGLDRLIPRLLPAVTAALLGWWALTHLPSGVDPVAERRPRDDGPMPEILQVIPASPWLRTAAGVAIGAGCTALAAALASGLWSSSSTRTARPARLVRRG